MKFKIIIIRLYAIIFGAILGLFIGISVPRIMFALIFNWTESGPEWANWIIALFVIISVVFSSLKFYQWANYYLKRRGFIK
jgi:hypothetical protein